MGKTIKIGIIWVKNLILGMILLGVAFVLTCQSIWRYNKGIRERVKMGMTFEQAQERAWREEQKTIESIRERIHARKLLQQRGLQ